MRTIGSYFVIAVLSMSIFVGMVSVTPISGVASAAQADIISVEAGGPYYNAEWPIWENDTFTVTATQYQTDAGPYTGSVPLITVYNETMVKIYDAQPMNLVDAALGLYNYSGSCGGLLGMNTVVVSGTNSTTSAITATGITTFEVSELIAKIDVLDPEPIDVQVNAVNYYGYDAEISAQITKNGEAYILDPADEIRITLMQWDGSKDVDNVSMTPLDISTGLYHHYFLSAVSGVWSAIVNVTVGGVIYTGMDQLMIVYPPDDPQYYSFDVETSWNSDLIVTAHLTVNGEDAWFDAVWDEARVSIWEVDTGTLVVDDQLMDPYDSSRGLCIYNATGLSGGTYYLIHANWLGISGDRASGTAIAYQELTVVVLDPEPLEVDVEVGQNFDPWATGMGITATVTTEGKLRPDDGATTVRVTIYHSDDSNGVLTKVLDNQTMSVLDSFKGVYSYIWDFASMMSGTEGYYHIVVEVNDGSSWYVGTTSADVNEWVGYIYVLDMKADIIDWKLSNHIADYTNNWNNWTYFFNNYTDDLNYTLTKLNNTIGNISFSFDMTPMQNYLSGLINNLSGNLSNVDANVSSMSLQVNANAIQLANIIAQLTSMDTDQAIINQTLNECCALFKDYRDEWNITIDQIIDDLDFQNLTTLAIQSSIADFRSDFGDFWNDFNDTMASTVNGWFNNTWDNIELFENNITGILNQQNIDFALMENHLVGIMNNQDMNISRIDHNITSIDASVQQAFQNLYENHTTMRKHISNYWAEWNSTMSNIETDLDWLNSTLVIVKNDVQHLNATVQLFWDDFNTTWDNYTIGFNAYWQLLNVTIDGVNITLQGNISALSAQMTNFETNMGVLLTDMSGHIADIDQNITIMRTAMDNHFSTLWSQHNETHALVGLYWAEWNATINGIITDLDYVNMTTIATNEALMQFMTDFEFFWVDYNTTEAAHTAENDAWFQNTWTDIADFRENNTGMMMDQNTNISEIDTQLATGFQRLHEENVLTRSHISVYWGAWNTTAEDVQSDFAFVNDRLAEQAAAGDAQQESIDTNMILIVALVIGGIFMLIVFRRYIAYSLMHSLKRK